MVKKKGPDFLGKMKRLKRGPQIITPKDAAMILAYSGLEPGSKIVDAGTGSGFLAIFLATYNKPGKVYTYEKDERFLEIAKSNIKVTGMEDCVEVKSKDVTGGIDEEDVDIITLDLKDADKAIKHAESSLKKGGVLVVYSPTVDHLSRIGKEIKRHEFEGHKTIENIVREWKVDRTIRPETTGLMHTGFLTFAIRK